MLKQYLSPKELRKRHGVHGSTHWRWIKHRKFPEPIRFSPNVVRWDLAEVEAWEEEQRHNPVVSDDNLVRRAS